MRRESNPDTAMRTPDTTSQTNSTSRRRRNGIGRHRRLWALGSVAVTFGVVLVLSGCGEDSGEQQSSSPAPVASASSAGSGAAFTGGGITVSGTGAVTTVPDQARFSFGVQSDGTTAEAALAQTSEIAAAVIQALKDAGIDEADLQTQQVSVFPIYADDARRVSGYTASTSVSALIRDLDSAGEVVDAAVGAGANNVFGPSLDVADSDALSEEALGLAVEEARSRALALATAAGVELGEIIAVSESGSGGIPFGASAEAAAVEGIVPIEPGTREIRASVTVTFAID